MTPTWDWEALVDAHADKAYSFALGLCGNPEDAKELVQEAFARALDRIGTHDPGLPFESWFLTILKHLYLDGKKRYEKRYGQSLDAPIDAEGLTVADAVADGTETSPLDGLLAAERTEAVRRAMKALNPEQRAVLLMIDLEGLGYEEAARALDCPLNTVRSRIVRARAALREALAGREEIL